MSQSSFYFQLNEFNAHENTISCLEFGKHSGGVFVSGGYDCKVNIWAVGKTVPLLQFSDHKKEVSSVMFDNKESYVASGSYDGEIKLWDLSKHKVFRSFSLNHQTYCTTLEQHPLDNTFFASGSSDSKIHIWDNRTKACIQTYSNSNQSIKKLRFSPDGRWIVCGDQSGFIKLWDLSSGKILQEFHLHTQEIRDLAFHPHDFLLACGSDSQLSLWDMEKFQNIDFLDSTSNDSLFTSLTFTVEGRHLITAQNNMLQKFSNWNKLKTEKDSFFINWENVVALYPSSEKLLACTVNNNAISSWVINLNKMGKKVLKEDELSGNRTTKRVSQRRKSEFIRKIDSLLPFDSINKNVVVCSPPKKSDNDSIVSVKIQQESPTILQNDLVPGASPNNIETSSKENINTQHNKFNTNFQSMKSLPISTELQKQNRDFDSKKEEDIFDILLKPHASMCTLLSSRHSQLRLIKSAWTKNETLGIEALIQSKDLGVVVDVLTFLPNSKKYQITIESATLLIPILNTVLCNLQSDSSILSCLSFLEYLISKFASNPESEPGIFTSFKTSLCDISNTLNSFVVLKSKSKNIKSSVLKICKYLEEWNC